MPGFARASGIRPPILAVICCGAILLHGGCARSHPRQAQAAASGDYYSVAAASAAFFRYGPQQASGPDRKLPHNTLMTVTKTSFGYAKVRLDSGEEGYVARDDIRPAPKPAAEKTKPLVAPASLNYPEPNLPAAETSPAVEPTVIPSPSASP